MASKRRVLQTLCGPLRSPRPLRFLCAQTLDTAQRVCRKSGGGCLRAPLPMSLPGFTTQMGARHAQGAACFQPPTH